MGVDLASRSPYRSSASRELSVRDRVAEAAVVVALFEAVVEPGDVEAAGQRDVVRMLAEGFFVVREGLGPAAGDFQRAAFFDQAADGGR